MKSVPRLEFDQLAKQHDGERRSDARSRWSQFVSLVLGNLGNRHSLRDIEAALASRQSQHYHLNISNVSRSALARANEKLDPDFYPQLFYKLYQRCQQTGLMPAFVEVTEGFGSEMETVDKFDFPRGTVLVFDRG